MHRIPILLITLVCAHLAHAAETLAPTTQSAVTAQEPSELGKLLRDCAVTTQAPLPAGESSLMPLAPFVGNGEVGAIVTGDDRYGLSLFVSHAALRNYALGGVDIVPDVKAGAAPYTAELTQDIARSEVRAKAVMRGVPFEATVFTAENQPFIFCEVRNPGTAPLTIRVNTWARPAQGKGQPPLGMKDPFRIMGRPYPKALADTAKGLVFSETAAPGEDQWRWIPAEGGGHLRNVASGHHLALMPDGKVEMREEADADTLLEVQCLGWPYFTTFSHGDRTLTVDHDQPVAVPVKQKQTYPGLPVEGATHILPTGCAGRSGDIAWAGRAEDARDPVQRGLLATRVLGGTPGTTTESGETVVVIPPQSTVTVAVAIQGVCERKNNQPPDTGALLSQAQALLVPLTPDKIAELSKERTDAWASFWSKTWLDTGDLLMNRAWFGGLHLLRCSSRQGHTSPALYGLWHTVDYNNCGNGEFNNYNYQSQIYGACSANRPELAMAQFDDILRELPNAQRRAADAGYRGAVWQRAVSFHLASDKVLDAYPQPPVAPKKDRKKLGNDQLDAGAFLAQNFIDAYEKTLDPAFQKKAYLLLKCCADFYTDYMVFNEAQQRYELPESGAREGTGNDLNPCFSLAMIKRVLRASADWSEDLGVDESLRGKWRDIATRISAYPTGEVDGKTVFKEAENETRISLDGPGGNTALLQMVFPADDVGLDSDPKLLETARNTLAWFNSNPKKPSWLQVENNPAYIHAQAASMGWDAAEIHSWLRRYLEKHQSPGLVHNHWGVESAGTIEGIHRMMLQGQTGVLRFFPAWPKDKDAGFVRLRAKGAFLVSAQLKGGEIGGVNILSEKGTDLTVQNPWPGKSVAVLREGKPLQTVTGERFTLQTAANERLVLEPR